MQATSLTNRSRPSVMKPRTAALPVTATITKTSKAQVTANPPLNEPVLQYKSGWSRYEIHPDGLYLRDGKKRKLVCGCIVLAEHRSVLGASRVSVVIRFVDYLGAWQELAVARSEVMTPTARLINKLADSGLLVANKARAVDAIAGLYEHYPPQKSVRTTLIPGWHTVDPDGQHVYVTGGSRSISAKHCNVEVVLDKTVSGGPTSGGSLADWNKHVGALCRGNPALQFAVCASLASTIVGPSGFATPSFLIDTSTANKNLLMQVAASVTGDKAQLHCNGQSDVVAMAARRNDSLLLLDISKHNQQHISTIDTIVAGRPISKASGRSFRGVVLACGDQNDSAQQLHSEESGLLTIPVAADTFITKPNGQKTTDELTAVLRRNADRYYGTIATSFISHVADNYEKLASVLPAQIERLSEQLMSRTWATDRTIAIHQARQFALVAVAGETAISNNILNWKNGAANAAVESCFDLFVNGVRKTAALSDVEIFLRLQKFFQSAAGGKFVPLSEYDSSGRSIAGYTHKVDGVETFCVYPAYFETVLCRGIGKTAAIRVLKARNLLILGSRSIPTRQINIPLATGRDRPKASFYVIRDDIIRC